MSTGSATLANCREGRMTDGLGWTGGKIHLSQASRVRGTMSGSILVNIALIREAW